MPKFMTILSELDQYEKNVETHYAAYLRTQDIWGRLVGFLRPKA